MDLVLGVTLGVVAWFLVCYGLGGFYTVGPNERAVKTVFGRAERLGELTTLDDPIAEHLNEEERERYIYPQVRVIAPGGPYFKFPWERIYKVNIATETVSIGFDPENQDANQAGQVLQAVTKDQLNTGLAGQIRFTVCERNLYAYLFGVKNPLAHIMGFLHSVLRERIANFETPLSPSEEEGALAATGVSINDLRKNLRDLNERMEAESRSSSARYGLMLNAALITSIDPPADVESALAAINTAHNQVSSEISLAQAGADQKIVQSRRAVEIETLRAQAEIEPLTALTNELVQLKKNGSQAALQTYLRHTRLNLFRKAEKVFLEDSCK